MADILNQALKDANYGVSGKNSGPAVYYKITSYSMTRPSATSDTINYSIKLDAYMSKGGFMSAASNMTLTLSMYAGANKEYTICSAKTIKSTSDSWRSSSDTSPVKSGITVTGTFNAPNLSGDVPVWFITERTNGTTIGSGEVTNSSYTMNFPAKQYTITYEANGGTGGPSSQTFNYNSGEKISTQIPTKTGYTFIAWQRKDATTYTLSPGASIPYDWGSFTLVAQWEPLPYNVNINSTWVPCTIKVNVVGEGYIYVGESEDYQDIADFNSSMFEQYGIGPQDDDSIFYATRGDIPGFPFTDIANAIVWGQEAYDYGSGYSLYMKSDNVKQWVDCTI